MSRVLLLLSGLASAVAVRAADNPEVQPTLERVHYGPHERHLLNFWRASAAPPTPVVIRIHGGGWVRGGLPPTTHLYPFLGRGISEVAITYRLAPEHLVPAPLLDAARAVQFVRHHADEWGLDKTRVGLVGHSAGGCTSLWLAFHDDLADPENADPVLRESSKPSCVLSNVGQTFIDVKMVRDLVGVNAASHRMIWQTIGAADRGLAVERYAEFAALYREYSPLTHVDPSDPPVLLYYKFGGDNIHSSRFGTVLVERAQELGAPVYMYAPDRNVPPPAPYAGRWEFVYKQLLARETAAEAMDERKERP